MKPCAALRKRKKFGRPAMTTAFFAGIVASDCWKAGPTFTSSADLPPLMPRICRPLARPRAALVAITEAYGDFLGRYYSLESARKLFMLFANLPGQTVAELAEKLFRIFHLIFPIFRAHSQQFAHRFVRNLHPVQRQPVLRRNVTDRRLLRRPASFHALQYPFQHADIFAVTGPQEFAIRTLAEPVHVKNLRRFWYFLAQLQPVLKIIRHVVAAERQHAHRVPPRDAHVACRCRGSPARHRGAPEYPTI